MLCGVVVDFDLEVFRVKFEERVALPDDASVALGKIGRTPRRVQMVRGHQTLLDVGSRAHFCRRAYKNAHTAILHVVKKFALLQVTLRVVDEGNLIRRNPFCHEFCFEIVIDGKFGRFGKRVVHTGIHDVVLIRPAVHFPHQRTVYVEDGLKRRLGFLLFFSGFCGRCFSLGRGEIAEDKLCAFHIRRFLPQFEDPFGGGIDLGAFKVCRRRINHSEIQTRLAGIVRDLERVVYPRIARQVFHTPYDIFHILGLIRRALHHDVSWRAAHKGRRQALFPVFPGLFFQIRRCHHIGERPVHGQQFRHVLETGKSAFQLVVHPRGIQFPAARHLSERRGPGVEMLQLLAGQFLALQVALECVDFRNGVADGRTGEEENAAPPVPFLEIAALDIQIRRLGRSRQIAKPGDVHRRLEGEIFELLRFVDEKGVHAQVGKIDGVVFFAAPLHELVVLLFQAFPLLFKLLDRRAGSLRLLQLLCGVEGGLNLCLKDFLLHFTGAIDLAKGRVGDDDGIPVACGHAAEQRLPLVFREIVLVGDEQIGVGVEFEEFVAPLIYQMIRHNDHRLGHKAHALGFHDCRNARHRLPSAHHMVKKARAFLYGSPNHIFLMRAQPNIGIGVGKLYMTAVVGRRHMRVKAFVVEPRQADAPFIVLPDPLLERPLDFIRLLHGGSRQIAVNSFDRPAGIIALPGVLFHLDGGVPEQRLNQAIRRVFRDAPRAHVARVVVDVQPHIPPAEFRQIGNAVMPVPAVDHLLKKGGHVLFGNPCRAELDADVNGLDIGRHHSGQRVRVTPEAFVGTGGLLGNPQFLAHIARQVLVLDLPFAVGGIQENQFRAFQFQADFFHILLGFPQQFGHASEVDPPRFAQGDDQGILRRVRMGDGLPGGKHPSGENGRFLGGRRTGIHARPFGHCRRNAPIVFDFQRLHQRRFWVVSKNVAVCGRVQEAEFLGEGVIAPVELAAETPQSAFVSIGIFFSLQQCPQIVPEADQAFQARPFRFPPELCGFVAFHAKIAFGLDDDFPRARFKAVGPHFQVLKIGGRDKVLVLPFFFRLKALFPRLPWNENIGRQDGKASLNLLAKVKGFVGNAVDFALVRAAGFEQFPDDLIGAVGKIAVERDLVPFVLPFVPDGIGASGNPVLVLGRLGLAEKDNIRGDFRQGVLAESGVGQTESAQQFGVLGDMLTGGGIDGIHEMTAHHEGGNAALTELVYGFRQEVVVDGKLAEVGMLLVKKPLVTERRIAEDDIKMRRDIDVLVGSGNNFRFGVQIFRNL